MKIVTYNVNGLRQRIAQFGSLLRLLSSFDADIICFQETKLRRQELTADVVMADGYESFFSCTRTSDKGRTGYSGVATFCRVRSAFSSMEAALPLSGEEGFTRVLRNGRAKEDERDACEAEGLEEFAREDLVWVDNEGRCIITDHGHFVLFNIYGPRAGSDDMERIEFKHKFYDILKKRWEHILMRGKRIFVVGDLNIAPYAIDRCDAAQDFEKNEFRRWLRSVLVENGGPFVDVFRAKHPERTDAYTCWPSNTDHDFITCHVKDCDISTQYKRWKPGNGPRWKGGLSAKLEGSDHAPVFVTLAGICDIPQHDTPSLSTRYLPMVRGVQQTIASLLMKRRVIEESQVSSNLSCSKVIKISSSTSSMKRSFVSCDGSESNSNKSHLSSQESVDAQPDSLHATGLSSRNDPQNGTKKARKNQGSQLSLKSFFKRSADSQTDTDKSVGCPSPGPICTTMTKLEKSSSDDCGIDTAVCSSVEKEVNNVAYKEWQRIQQVMQSSIPLCKGHNEPCVSRVVKKAGLNFGRRFYTCPRAEGPASNPEANCGFFRWAASNFKR
ncbi:hypothetical protein MLD38_030830 [Melastoma candidum]|uniref:Uncharacterized protein n=1 Tax=Melastoma candidum TaxID=119954 RepID=A0ACB9MPE4_9MYRT|nr:hypothetical protein MLD38_030830 [Melastoma candidum]